jgi:hypothetical protein
MFLFIGPSLRWGSSQTSFVPNLFVLDPAPQARTTRFFLLLLATLATATNLFPSEPKDAETIKQSKSTLKENLGSNIKKTLDECAELNGRLGKIQHQLSGIQKQLLNKGEELLDNGPAFKQKDHRTLFNSVEVTDSANKKLTNLLSSLENNSLASVIEALEQDECLKKTNNT